MRSPGFSRLSRRNTERWTVHDLSGKPCDRPKMERPCFMPMRSPDDFSALSGVVYLDYDRKSFGGRGRGEVVRLLRDRPEVGWAGRSAGDGALALAWAPELAGLELSAAKSEYGAAWDRLSALIYKDAGLVADRAARGASRVVFQPRDRIGWSPPPVPPRTPADPGKGRLGTGASAPSALDMAVGEDPDAAWALLGLVQGANDCPLAGCAHRTPEGHLSVGGGSKPWMAVHYDSDGERGYGYRTLWGLILGPADDAEILGSMEWASEAPDLAACMVRWSEVDMDVPLPSLDLRGFVSSQHVTWMFGARGTGKTWVALWLAVDHVEANAGRVLWVSAEMADHRMVDRLATLGKMPLAPSVDSLHPRWIEAASPAQVSALADWLAAEGVLVVLDSAGSLRAGETHETLDRWRPRYLDPWINASAGVVVLDHLRKRPAMEEGERIGPIGTVHKQNAADAMLYLDGRMEDRLDIRLAKKRDMLYDDVAEGDVLRILRPETAGGVLSIHCDQPMTAPSGQRLSSREVAVLASAGDWTSQAEFAHRLRWPNSDELLRLELHGLVQEGMLEVRKKEGDRRVNEYRRPGETRLHGRQ